tara:strand:+ start:76 stop:672 length:597 start_codon:yes stop_codon:yes gene_type:complete
MAINFLITLTIIYLLGSIPFGFIFTKFFRKVDIRNIGSGNIGATNVLRTGNKFLAIIVLMFDILKGYIPTFILINYINLSNDLFAMILGSVAILGHLFPIWLKFKGGKGVATYIGFIFAVNYYFGIIFIFSWLSIAFLSRYSSLASIFSLITLPLIIIFLGYKPSVFLLFLIISIILIIKHHSNIKRLLDRKETKIKF